MKASGQQEPTEAPVTTSGQEEKSTEAPKADAPSAFAPPSSLDASRESSPQTDENPGDVTKPHDDSTSPSASIPVSLPSRSAIHRGTAPSGDGTSEPPTHTPSTSKKWPWILGIVLLIIAVAIAAAIWFLPRTSETQSDPTSGSVVSIDVPKSGLSVAELRDACGAGDMLACDQLYFESVEGSEDEEFGNTCGGTRPPGTYCHQPMETVTDPEQSGPGAQSE